MADVSKLLTGAPGGVDFLSNIELRDADENLLKAARLKIRDHLRSRIVNWTKQNLPRALTPRFFTQGSFAYKTINLPAWPASQKMDMDDGTYLPMTFVKGAKPSIAAAKYFEVVDGALEELIREEGWRNLVKKPTCSRVILNAKAHIDVPLYAIPDDEFVRLNKALARDQAFRTDEDIDFMDSRRRRDTWDVLPSDQVLLAHREEDWKSSDPRKIHDWFVNAVERYREVLRRQSRYLKAWRDHHHLDYISSIFLMICVWEVFEELTAANIPNRDDLVLLEIAKRLPRLLSQPVENPADRSEKVGESLTSDERKIAVDRANQMFNELHSAIHQCYLPQVAVDHVRTIFGDRVPNRPDLIGVHHSAKAEVRSYPRAITPAPLVGRSVSG